MSLANLMFHRVDLQRETTSKDSSGGVVTTFATITNQIPANVQDVSGTDLLFAKQYNIQITHTVYVIENIGFALGDRLLFGDDILYVKNIRNLINKGRVWALDCYSYLDAP